MTVVEAYVGGTRLDDVGNTKMMSAIVSSLLMEGISQNTTGSVFEPEVTDLFTVHYWQCVFFQRYI